MGFDDTTAACQFVRAEALLAARRVTQDAQHDFGRRSDGSSGCIRRPIGLCCAGLLKCAEPRMAQPPLRSLRPARSRGLTSPDQVRTPRPEGHPANPAPDRNLWTSRRKRQRREQHARKQPAATKTRP